MYYIASVKQVLDLSLGFSRWILEENDKQMVVDETRKGSEFRERRGMVFLRGASQWVSVLWINHMYKNLCKGMKVEMNIHILGTVDNLSCLN